MNVNEVSMNLEKHNTTILTAGNIPTKMKRNVNIKNKISFLKIHGYE